MRLSAVAFLCCLPALSAWAQSSPPLQPYVPPPTSSPLAPLPGDTTATPVQQALGQVRLNATTSSNMSPADTHSLLAPSLPAPDTTADTPEAYLAAARAAIAANQTGAAQEALERAESRALDRDVAPSAADHPVTGPLIDNIEAARAALAAGNGAGAIAAIDAALRG